MSDESVLVVLVVATGCSWLQEVVIIVVRVFDAAAAPAVSPPNALVVLGDSWLLHALELLLMLPLLQLRVAAVVRSPGQPMES